MLYYAAISNTNPASGLRIIFFYSTISFFFFFLLLSRYCSKFLDVVVSIHIIFCNCFVLTPSSDPTGTHGDWSSSDASVRQNGHPNIYSAKKRAVNHEVGKSLSDGHSRTSLSIVQRLPIRGRTQVENCI